MSLVEFHRLAAREFREARAWYAKRSPETAERFTHAVDASVTRILSDPVALPIVLRNTRSVRVKRFPYRLVFEQRPQQRILILAVAHTSRRPDYWRRRT